MQRYTWLEYWCKLEDKWSESKGYGWCIQAISHWGVGSASLLDFEHDKTWLYANKKRQIWSGHKEILPHMMKLVEKTESIHFSSLPYFAQFGVGCRDILTDMDTSFLKIFSKTVSVKILSCPVKVLWLLLFCYSVQMSTT